MKMWQSMHTADDLTDEEGHIRRVTKPLGMLQLVLRRHAVPRSQQAAGGVEADLEAVLGADLHGFHHSRHLVRPAAAHIGCQHIRPQLQGCNLETTRSHTLEG